MSRKTIEITVSTKGRDEGKKFLVTEMSAAQGERWGNRALAAMARAGFDMPDGVEEAGLGGVVALGLRAFVAAPHEETKPLMDEMLGCVQIVEPVATRALLPDDIEEIVTILQLRDEVLGLHLGFSLRGVLSDWIGASRKQAEEAGRATSMSPEPSELSSLTA